MQTALERLISPITMGEFLSHYKRQEPLLIQHQSDELLELRNLPFLNSLADLLNSWPHPIQAHLPDVRDEASSIDTTAKDAHKLFANGMGLLFNEAHSLSPMLDKWLQEMRMNLGLSDLTYSRCLIYATPDGKGTSPHFDQNINFVLQIQGTKKWWIAPNQQVLNPMSRHTMGLAADPELMSYAEEELPTQMPAEACAYELKPGSLLFVPRGAWHATEAEGDALSLNFTFSAPTWIDLLTAALRSRLALSPEWRETADGVSDPERSQEAEARFDYLLSTLVNDLPHWRAQDILGATEFI